MNVTDSFADRLKILRDWLEVKREQDYIEKMGITRDNFKSYTRGSQPSLDKVANILSSVENLNPEWLVMGEGEMIRKKDKKKDEQEKDLEYFKDLVNSQQETIRAQSKSIENLSSKGGNGTADNAKIAHAK